MSDRDQNNRDLFADPGNFMSMGQMVWSVDDTEEKSKKNCLYRLKNLKKKMFTKNCFLFFEESQF